MARDSITKSTTQGGSKTTFLEDSTIPHDDNVLTTIPRLDIVKKDKNDEDLSNNTADHKEILEEEETKPSPSENITSVKNSATTFPDKAMPGKTSQWNPEHPCIEAVQAAILNMKITPKPKWGSAAATKGYQIKGLVKGKWGYKKSTKKQRPTSK
jgi:hypothetical protein